MRRLSAARPVSTAPFTSCSMFRKFLRTCPPPPTLQPPFPVPRVLFLEGERLRLCLLIIIAVKFSFDELLMNKKLPEEEIFSVNFFTNFSYLKKKKKIMFIYICQTNYNNTINNLMAIFFNEIKRH